MTYEPTITIFMTCFIDAFPIFLLANYPLPAINCFPDAHATGYYKSRDRKEKFARVITYELHVIMLYSSNMMDSTLQITN